MKQDANFFAKGDELRGNATIGPSLDPWHQYAYGFRRAAGILLKHVAEQHTSLDVIVFPTIFLLRHHLELAIKIVVRDARSVLGLSPPAKPEHRLAPLWFEAKRLLTDTYKAKPLGLEVIDGVVTSFDDIDSNSTTFRYPETLDGTNPLSDISSINLLTLRDSAEPAFDILDGIHMSLQMRLDDRGAG